MVITGSDWSLLDSSSESISKSKKCSRDKSLSETDDDMKVSDDEGEVNSNEEHRAEIDKLADGQFNLAVKVNLFSFYQNFTHLKFIFYDSKENT